MFDLCVTRMYSKYNNIYISSTVVNRPLQIWVLPTVLKRVFNTKQARKAQWALPRSNAPVRAVQQGWHVEINGALPQPPPKTLPVNGRDKSLFFCHCRGSN